ncbi:hypothetical protein E2562_020838 [Oryza meyeriana var. granulata]|uniref:Uncharacterized protein n=1 Tax=Oryza meyeriana var. granulata TaxID=110450 RepID=A0A6G1FAM6_9ORYZ|nr:hypothetical protein E2562_020838 [Oryza meyeriana var. granulata]
MSKPLSVYHQYLIYHGLLTGDVSKEEIKEDESFEDDEDGDKGSKKKVINIVLEMRIYNSI